MQDELKPVAWRYAPTGTLLPGHDPYFVQVNRANMDPRYWIETPLYAHPPTTNPVDVSATPVGDHQMVEAVARAIAHVLNKDDIPDGGWPGLMKEAAHAAINQIAEGDVVRRAQQRTIDRLHREAEGLRTKLVDALADRQAALTAARAQVEGESEYRKVHEQAVIKRGEAWANHHMTSDGLIGERVTNDTASHIIRTTTEVFALAAGEHRKDG